MYHIVESHADGGQMCVPGVRCFEDPDKAERFAKRMREQSGHMCHNSVRTYDSEAPVENEEYEYPFIAGKSADQLYALQGLPTPPAPSAPHKPWPTRILTSFSRLFD